MELKRADVALCEAGLAESRTKARELIKAGVALIDGVLIEKPSQLVDPTAQFSLTLDVPADVSRAGQKLRAAIEAFRPEIEGKVFIDIGASTGGFTQCLLEHGAAKVYAVDVGTDQLHRSLREDSRVVVMEGVNARTLTSDMFDSPIDGIVMDVSFISQTLIYPAISALLPSGAPLISLVKPQFEVGRENVGKKGIVKDKKGSLMELVTLKIRLAAEDNGLKVKETICSPIKGSKGNTEYLTIFYKQ